MNRPLNLVEVLSRFEETWSPKTVARINNYEARVAKMDGEFVWHQHDDTDEFFMVLSGELTIQLDSYDDVVLQPNDVFVVAKGVRHCPVAKSNTAVLLLEPANVVNTGDVGGAMTAAVEDLTN